MRACACGCGAPARATYVHGHNGRRRNVIDAFLARIQKLDNGCWLWMASKNRGGYGYLALREGWCGHENSQR